MDIYGPDGQPINTQTVAKTFKKISIISIIMFLVIAAFFVLFILMPPLDPSFGFTLWIGIFLVIGLVWRFGKSMKLKMAVLVLLALPIAGQIYASPVFQASEYRNLIGEVQEKDYAENVADVAVTKLPVVDQALAEKLGDKVLGNDLGLGSQFTIGEYYLIDYAGELAWVAPLEPIDFFKWLQNMEGSPGYIRVSATDQNDVKLVQTLDNGEPVKIKYSKGSFLLNKLDRHVYLNGFMQYGLTDYSFEIDDAGRPYWVVSEYRKEIGYFGGDNVSRVIIVDAQTGEITAYTPDEAPEWANRVYPRQMMYTQINDWGLYKNGFINTLFGRREMLQVTEGGSYMFIDGQNYFYTGLTSAGRDESTVGFMLVNTRTKESTFYKVSGATETTAMRSAEGIVQDLGYQATFPILVNVQGKPTYFMTLKDNEGLVKRYAYVSVENYNNVGVGSTINEAQKDYVRQLTQDNQITTPTEGLTSLTAVVERIETVIIDSQSLTYLKVADNKTLFIVSPETSAYAPVTKIGDTVELKYLPADTSEIIVNEFTNTSW
ncbi:MAG: hypothetical protein ACRCZG_05945 [Culicoidibacterales bacterium]